MITYCIKPVEKEGWEIRCKGAAHFFFARTRRGAEKVAMQIVQNRGGGRVEIFNKEGDVVDVFTVT